MTEQEIKSRLKALSDYEFSVIRIGEDSDAADRELMRIIEAKSKLNSMLRQLGTVGHQQ
jgi:hypothetical protein